MSKRMPDELNPCPFCGKRKAKLFSSAKLFGPNHAGGFIVVCDAAGIAGSPDAGCGAVTGYQETEEEAVAAWNRRPAPERAVAKGLQPVAWIDPESLQHLMDEYPMVNVNLTRERCGMGEAHNGIPLFLKPFSEILRERAPLPPSAMRQIPERLKEAHGDGDGARGYVDGWNACLDAIAPSSIETIPAPLKQPMSEIHGLLGAFWNQVLHGNHRGAEATSEAIVALVEKLVLERDELKADLGHAKHIVAQWREHYRKEAKESPTQYREGRVDAATFILAGVDGRSRTGDEFVVTRQQLEPLLQAGAQLSNIAFNLKQHRGRNITEQDAQATNRAQEAWDRALRNLWKDKP